MPTDGADASDATDPLDGASRDEDPDVSTDVTPTDGGSDARDAPGGAGDVGVPVDASPPADGPPPTDGPETQDASGPGDGSGPDSGGTSDSGPDAAPPGRCDLSKPFGTPMPVAGLPAGSVNVRLSPDELTLFFNAWTDNGQWDLFGAVRASLQAPFTETGPLFAFNTTAQDVSLTLTSDGLTAYWESNRGGPYRIYVATRKTLGDPFIGATVVAPGISVGDGAPFVTLTGSALYFTSFGPNNFLDLYRANVAAGVATKVVPLASLNTSATDAAPVITADDLTIFFDSDRTSASHGGFDLWMATRQTTAQDFGSPRNVDELNTASDEAPTWISPDGCHLYFDRADARSSTVMVAVRP